LPVTHNRQFAAPMTDVSEVTFGPYWLQHSILTAMCLLPIFGSCLIHCWAFEEGAFTVFLCYPSPFTSSCSGRLLCAC